MKLYSVTCTFRPIVTWPGATTPRRSRSRFKAPYSRTVDDLDRELHHLGARDVVIELALDESEIRRDGLPRSTARPRHPGVVLSFNSKHGPLRYPCDTYDRWEDNLRAIALALAALRAVDRYGVTRRAEQYTGWKALPSGNGDLQTREAAAQWMSEQAGRFQKAWSAQGILADEDHAKFVYRFLAGKLHPDVNQGDDAQFKKLQQCRKLLE